MKNRDMKKLGYGQKGLTTVEFAIIAASLIIVLFGVIEVSRALFVWNTIGEATRRGARVAEVCPVNHGAIKRLAVFGSGWGSATASPVLSGLSTSNVTVQYLNASGTVLADPAASFSAIQYVRVSINNYQHTMIIPFIMPTLNVPPFATTVPVESLGYLPDTATWACFGTAT
ncbi:MAG: TadE/TadG family type IV pilus assembly protein [Gammaproteobacteria bacterium]